MTNLLLVCSVGLILLAKRQPANKRSKKATSLEVFPRIGICCCGSLQAARDLGDHPSISRVKDLRGTLKELWTLINIQDTVIIKNLSYHYLIVTKYICRMFTKNVWLFGRSPPGYKTAVSRLLNGYKPASKRL